MEHELLVKNAYSHSSSTTYSHSHLANSRMAQEILAEEFSKALEIEQTSDSQLTDSYLAKFSPRKLASLGLAIVNLACESILTGYGGKSILHLVLDSAVSQHGDFLNLGTLRVGDIVKIARMGGKSEKPSKQEEQEGDTERQIEGVITRLGNSFLTVAVDETSSDESLMALVSNTRTDSVRLYIVKLSNIVVYKRMFQAMQRLRGLKDSEKSQIIQILLGEARCIPKEVDTEEVKFFDDTLNSSQKKAVAFSIHGLPISIIHGPPGTGKTYTILELTKQLVFNNNERVLICGASNMSVDNILERLLPNFRTEEEPSSKKNRRKKPLKKAHPESLIRIGHPARLMPVNLVHSLDILCKSLTKEGGVNDNLSIIKDIENDISAGLAEAKKTKSYQQRKAVWAQVKELRRELRARETRNVQDLLVGAKVILATLHGSGANELHSLYKKLDYGMQKPFVDTIIIDEVSQSLEPQCWIALLNHVGCKRLVIAGDDKQLSATVKSREEVAKRGKNTTGIADLGKTLFDRLVRDLQGNSYKMLLDTQYRMNEKIMAFASLHVYDGLLKADNSVANILLPDIPGVESCDDTREQCIWYDTQGGDYPEQMSEDGFDSAGSKFNEMEVEVVRRHLNLLVKAGVPAGAIGVISPYSAQVGLLKKAVGDIENCAIEVATVDGFQGREKEVIVLSMVRSNERFEVGFLEDPRRLNVAMTRPKRQLCVVGDLELLERCTVPYLQAWATHVSQNFDVRYPEMQDY